THTQVGQRRQAAETEGKISTLSAAMDRIRGEREGVASELAATAQRAREATVTSERLQRELDAGAAENKELLTICNQLLSQVEQLQLQARQGDAAAGAS
ncbi:hypothetical protein FOA52_008645, partial [Chlamydomonas sp. UWO 241]